MSQPGPPHAVPDRPSVKRRVIIGVLCLTLALVGVIGSFVFLFMGLFSTDGDVPVDGEQHTISLGSDAERMVFVQDGASVRCQALDADGSPLTLRGVSGTFTKSINGEDRVGVWTFKPSGDSVEMTCSGKDQLDVQVGPSSLSGSRIATIGIGFGVSALIGIVGVILLITALIRKVRQPARW